jgi:hypothetical protein
MWQTSAVPVSLHGLDGDSFTFTSYRITCLCNIHSNNSAISKVSKISLFETLTKEVKLSPFTL